MEKEKNESIEDYFRTLRKVCRSSCVLSLLHSFQEWTPEFCSTNLKKNAACFFVGFMTTNRQKKGVWCSLAALFLVLLLFLPVFALGHGTGDEDEKEEQDSAEHGEEEALQEEIFTLVNRVQSMSLQVLAVAVLVIVVVMIYALAYDEHARKYKTLLFSVIVIAVLAGTLFLAGSTLYLNMASATRGPVHWHADYEIWSCGKQLDMKDPEGMANRVGTRLFHEHGDKRMHAEGIIEDIRDVDLHNFFNFVGGFLSENSFSVPTNDGVFSVEDGEFCNGEAGEVQIFVYIVTNADPKQKTGFLVEQLKVNEKYVLSPYQDVPPGDCIIIEFDKRKDKTDKICETYRIAVEQGRMMIL